MAWLNVWYSLGRGFSALIRGMGRSLDVDFVIVIAAAVLGGSI